MLSYAKIKKLGGKTMSLKDKIITMIINELPMWSLEEDEDIDILVEQFEDNATNYERLIIVLEDVINELNYRKKMNLSKFIKIMKSKIINKNKKN